MTRNTKEEAKKRSELLVELRKSHRDRVKEAQTQLKEQQKVRKILKGAIHGEPKTVPQLSEATGIPAHEVLWHVAAMKKYGDIAEAGMDEDYEYYLYQLAKEAAS
jgi:diphthamide synthase (EF-2-diphthine--ammonia ligase)